jgi:hypothetical protein
MAPEEIQNKSEAWDYYQNLLKSHGYDSITQLLSEVNRLNKMVLNIETMLKEELNHET